MADLLVVVFYMAAVLAVGLWTGRKVKSARDFSVSHTRYGLFTMVATLSSAFIGGGFSTGNATETFSHGAGNVVALLGFSAGQLLIAKLLLPRVRGLHDCVTPGDIMAKAYGPAARTVTGLCSFFFSAGILAVQVAAIGHIFRQLTGIPYTTGILIGFSIVLFYATVGGAASVIAIDRMLFVVLMTGIPLLVFFALRSAGGIQAAVDALPPEHFNITAMGGGALAGLFLSLMVGEALNPPYIQRMFAGKGARTLARATFITAFLSVPFFFLTGAAGLLMRAIDPSVAAEMAMPALILRVMPPILRGLVISSMLAIVMSSADTILTTAAVGLSQDTILPLLPRRPASARQLRMIRLINALTGAVAMTIALLHADVFRLLLFSYRFWAPVILAPLIGALWGCRAKPVVFFLSAAGGGLASLLYNDAALSVAVGFGVSALVYIAALAIVSHKTPGSRQR